MFPPKTIEQASEQIDQLLTLFDLEFDGQVLDIPCGVGRHAVELRFVIPLTLVLCVVIRSALTGAGTSGESPTENGHAQTQSLPYTLTIRSTGDKRAFYRITASKALTPGPGADLTNANHPDTTSHGTASGSVAEHGVDNYTFSGKIIALNLSGGPANVSIDGKQIDPADYPTSAPGSTSRLTAVPVRGPPSTRTPTGSSSAETTTGSSSTKETTHRLSKAVVIRSTGDNRAFYTLRVGGRIRPGQGADLTHAKQPDRVSHGIASGSVAERGVDNYTYTGEIVALTLSGGPANVSMNGKQVDPADYANPSTSLPLSTATPITSPTTASTPPETLGSTQISTSTARPGLTSAVTHVPTTSSTLPGTPTPTQTQTQTMTSTTTTTSVPSPTTSSSPGSTPASTGTLLTSSSTQQGTAVAGSQTSSGSGPGLLVIGLGILLLLVIVGLVLLLIQQNRRPRF